MKSPIERLCAFAAGLAVWASVSVAGAQVVLKYPDYPNSHPTCQEVKSICEIRSVVHDLLITNLTTKGNLCVDGVCTYEEIGADGLTYQVKWRLDATGSKKDGYPIYVESLTPNQTQDALAPGVRAIIAQGKNSSNIYCGTNVEEASNISAPPSGSQSTPTPSQLEVCWTPSPFNPCLQTTGVDTACAAFGPLPAGYTGSGHYLQAHSEAKPKEPLNICGCPVPGDGVVARICGPNTPVPCPEDEFTALHSEAFATLGAHSCTLSGARFYTKPPCF